MITCSLRARSHVPFLFGSHTNADVNGCASFRYQTIVRPHCAAIRRGTPIGHTRIDTWGSVGVAPLLIRRSSLAEHGSLVSNSVRSGNPLILGGRSASGSGRRWSAIPPLSL